MVAPLRLFSGAVLMVNTTGSPASCTKRTVPVAAGSPLSAPPHPASRRATATVARMSAHIAHATPGPDAGDGHACWYSRWAARAVAHAPVAQRIERRFPVPKVAGSTPVGGTSRSQPMPTDALRVANSSAVSSRSAASAESLTDSGREAPGIGITRSESDSSHASATCCGDTP